MKSELNVLAKITISSIQEVFAVFSFSELVGFLVVSPIPRRGFHANILILSRRKEQRDRPASCGLIP